MNCILTHHDSVMQSQAYAVKTGTFRLPDLIIYPSMHCIHYIDTLQIITDMQLLHPIQLQWQQFLTSPKITEPTHLTIKIISNMGKRNRTLHHIFISVQALFMGS